MDLHLKSKVALVTGGGRGVGRGVCIRLAEEGAKIVVNDYHGRRAERVAAEIREAGGQALPVEADITDIAKVRAMLAQAVETFGPVDILVNNAGNAGAHTMVPKPFRDTEPAEWEGPLRVNVYGVMNCTHTIVGGMCDRGWGRIVTISSGAGTRGVNIGVAAYSAGKGAGISFTRTLALEVAKFGVTANTLAIGLMGRPDPKITAAIARSIPVGRTGVPDDVAAACAWLVSEEAAWVTGQRSSSTVARSRRD
jgi:NAD(P)-dependent dehydrogenase (short-subunit alcohol dehydrogenase family)